MTKKLSDIPTALEPRLDMSFIEALSREPMPPGSITAGWHVYIETHFLGGRAMFYNWEIADIGLLIQIRHRGKLARAKIALLQSKRLYPDEIRKLPDLRRKYQQGFLSLMLTDEDHRLLVGGRTFHFTEKSLYREYTVKGEQEKRVAQYEQDHEIPVYYLFYNPREIPWQATIPFSHRAPNTRPRVGCRVVPSALLASRLDVKGDGKHPNYGDLRGLPQPFSSRSHLAGWRVER